MTEGIKGWYDRRIKQRKKEKKKKKKTIEAYPISDKLRNVRKSERRKGEILQGSIKPDEFNNRKKNRKKKAEWDKSFKGGFEEANESNQTERHDGVRAGRLRDESHIDNNRKKIPKDVTKEEKKKKRQTIYENVCKVIYCILG